MRGLDRDTLAALVLGILAGLGLVAAVLAVITSIDLKGDVHRVDVCRDAATREVCERRLRQLAAKVQGPRGVAGLRGPRGFRGPRGLPGRTVRVTVVRRGPTVVQRLTEVRRLAPRRAPRPRSPAPPRPVRVPDKPKPLKPVHKLPSGGAPPGGKPPGLRKPGKKKCPPRNKHC